MPSCDRFLKTVRANSGPGKAKSCKTVLSLLLGLAVRHGAIQTNPVRDVAKIKRGHKAAPKALTVEETDELLAKIAVDTEALEQDVPELVEFLLGTGLRIGEALGLASDAIDVETKTLEVCQIAVRLSGQGTVLQPRPKSAAGWRVLALPDHVFAICERRMAAAAISKHHLLFPGLAGGVRNPSNANRDMKAAIVRAVPGLSWFTSHTGRKTVATRLDEAGLTAREIADHLGHAKPSMTQDVYMGRGVASAAAAAVLSREAA